MPLAGYKSPSRTVSLGGGQSCEVRGLSFDDFAALLRTHLPDLEAIFDLFTNIEGVSRDQFDNVAATLIAQAPGLVANVIALAAGEGDASDAERLPGPIQLNLLNEIGDLTFTEAGGVKKFMEMIAALLKQTNLKTQVTKALKTAG